MSLDERLQSGLRTTAEPAQDSERALHAFRGKAYSRRGRRRMFESVGAVVVAAAIALGSTAVVSKLSSKATGYVSRPPEMPTCSHDDLILSPTFSAGPAVVVEYAYTSVHKPCWIDEQIRLTLSGTRGVLSQTGSFPLNVIGNGSIIRIRGIVPAYGFNKSPTLGSPVLGIAWQWTNWCGDLHDTVFQFDPLKNGEVFQYLMEKQPSHSCADKSKPSELRPRGGVTERS
jgi:hypothetical protein